MSAIERALIRERKAREKAEFLLEEKSRELYQSNQDILAQNQELSFFFSIAKQYNADINTEQALSIYINAVRELSGWPVGHVYMPQSSENSSEQIKLISKPIWCFDDQEKFKDFVDATEKISFQVGQGLPGKVFEQKNSIWINEIFADIELPRSNEGRASGFHGAFGVPIFRYEKVIAVAEFFSEKPVEQDEHLLMIVEAAAKQLGTILERRLAEKKLKHNYEALESAHKELKDAQAQLVQSSKLASIGQLAAGVAHEINNPIAFVANNISVLKKYIGTLKEVIGNNQSFLNEIPDADEHLSSFKQAIIKFNKQKNLDFILDDLESLMTDSIDGMDRVTKIVSGLKSFARVDEAEFKEVDLNECIESTIKVVWNEIKYKCTINKNLNELPLVKCNPGKLNQVFMNLIVNAGQAIEEQGEIIINSHATENEVVISIQDSGSGISEENIEKLFDPFFTTKPVGVGTGLGLSISYGIVQDHNGQINVSSELGVGTTFEIILPIKQAETDLKNVA